MGQKFLVLYNDRRHCCDQGRSVSACYEAGCTLRVDRFHART
jgi:hypothetical protein